MPQIKTGRLRALAVTSARRTPLAPQLPTMAEAGIAGFEVSSWFGLLAPAGTSRAVLARLNKEVVTALHVPDVRERFLSQGLEPVSSSPEEFAAYIRSEMTRWGEIVKESGASAD